MGKGRGAGGGRAAYIGVRSARLVTSRSGSSNTCGGGEETGKDVNRHIIRRMLDYQKGLCGEKKRGFGEKKKRFFHGSVRSGGLDRVRVAPARPVTYENS